MRTLIIAAATAVGFALPAAAANVNNTSPGPNNPAYNTPSYNQEAKQQNNGTDLNGQAGNQNNVGSRWQNPSQRAQNTGSIRQRIYDNLSQAGFTDIRIMPRAFLVRARDRDGNPVTMMITPNSVTALTESPRNNGQSMYSGNEHNGMGNNGNGPMSGTGGRFGGSNNTTSP